MSWRWLIDILAFLEARFIHKDLRTMPAWPACNCEHKQEEEYLRGFQAGYRQCKGES